jgi:hypothetical protein
VSSIILSTTALSYQGGESSVDINIFVEDEDWLGIYNRLQVFRSKTGSSGPFEEITDEAWSPPRIPHDAGDPPSPAVTGSYVNLVGETLDLLVDHDVTVSVTFTGSNPLSFAQAAAQITAQGLMLVSSYVDEAGQLVVEAARPGLDSRLTVIPGDAAFILGLPTMEPGASASGKEPRLNLVPNQVTYLLRDTFGSTEYFYKTRFLNAVTGAQSEATLPSSPRPSGITPPNVVIGFLDLVYPSGGPWEGAEVYVYQDVTGPLVEGKLTGTARTVKYTDAAGHVEFELIRGQRLTVSVQGSNFVRTLTVPTDPEIKKFNFFAVSVAEPDVFTVSVPNIITAERRTL